MFEFWEKAIWEYKPISKKERMSIISLIVISVLFIIYVGYIPFVFVSITILFHEYGHYIANKLFKKDVTNIKFSLFNRPTVYSSSSKTPTENIIISLFGPLFGLLPIGIIIFLLLYTNISTDSLALTLYLIIFSQFINLIPVQDSDGDNILSSIKIAFKSSHVFSYIISFIYYIILCLLFIMFVILSYHIIGLF